MCAGILYDVGRILQVGNGANMKLVVNMIMGSFMAASAEGLELAKGVGLKDEDLIEVVNMAAIATPMFKLKVTGLMQNLGAPGTVSPFLTRLCDVGHTSLSAKPDPDGGALLLHLGDRHGYGCHLHDPGLPQGSGPIVMPDCRPW